MERTIRESDSGILSAVKKTPPHYLFGVMLFAFLWLMAQYFVTDKEYAKDNAVRERSFDGLRQDINEIKHDIKDILKRGNS